MRVESQKLLHIPLPPLDLSFAFIWGAIRDIYLFLSSTSIFNLHHICINGKNGSQIIPNTFPKNPLLVPIPSGSIFCIGYGVRLSQNT